MKCFLHWKDSTNMRWRNCHMIIGNVSEPIFRMCGFLVQSEELVCINQKAVSNVEIHEMHFIKTIYSM